MINESKDLFYSLFQDKFSKEINPDLLVQVLTGATIYAIKWWLDNDNCIDKASFVNQLVLISSLMQVNPINHD
ncbi:MAG: hypothetical protein BWY54_00979 [Candidatus Dependentiae bacterium ADurb.Bin331]|nr:MAG: hypothetical protein BWY54_00979 [Candidatus Dependentiae bacterium ADurb.Bin331]